MKRDYDRVLGEIKAFLQTKVNVEVDILRKVDPASFAPKYILTLDKKETGILI